MELKFIHLAGPLLAIAAFFSLGRNMVRKGRGRSINPMPALVLLLIAVVFHFFSGVGTLLDRVCLLLLDFGIAMIIDSGYLAANKEDARVFWVPGFMAIILAAGLYVFASAAGFSAQGLWDKEPVAIQEGVILLELGPDDQIEEVEPILQQYGATWEDAFPEISLEEDEDLAQYFLINVEAGKIKELREALGKDTENVDHTELNSVWQLPPPLVSAKHEAPAGANFLANDPRLQQQWWFKAEATNFLHQLLQKHPPQRKARVAILDTGIDGEHEDLSAAMGDSQDQGDANGHGTHCAGLAGAVTHNGIGMASLNWEGKFIELLNFKALPGGSGTSESVSQAIINAAKAKVDVINLSLGGPARPGSKVHEDAIEYALKQGAIVVTAAGNNGKDARDFSPANVPGVITVAAIDSENQKASFSNRNTGLKMPLAAPGVGMLSAKPEGDYQNMDGTSMAAPIVSGIIGILRAYRPDISPQEAWQLLHDTGIPGPDQGEAGRTVNPTEAIRTLLGQ